MFDFSSISLESLPPCPLILAASGALEAAFTLMGMNEGIILPTINLKKADPECDLDYAKETRKTEIRAALSNSFRFGGVNAVLVFRTPP